MRNLFLGDSRVDLAVADYCRTLSANFLCATLATRFALGYFVFTGFGVVKFANLLFLSTP